MVIMLLGTGFEESEAVVPLDLLRRAGVEVSTAGVTGTQVTSSHGIAMAADCALSQVDAAQVEMVILLGGLGGVDVIGRSQAALKLVEPGDPVIFDSRYVEFGDGLIKSRALDDRAGCGMLLSAMEHRYPVELAAVFTVQEEIGTRGAKAAAYRLDPDAALVLEGTTCADIAGVKDEQKVTRLGKGPVVGVRDSSAVHDPRLRAFVLETAAKYGIAVQNREGTFGGTDCGSIQRSRGGVPVAMMAVATRFIHSPVTVIARKDYEAGCALLAHVLQDMESFLNDKEGDCNE